MDAAAAAGIVCCFLAGVVSGGVIGARFEERRPAAVLLFIAALLALAALLRHSGILGPAIALLALAMGSANAVFERDGEVRFGVTYMTGSLVRVGNGIASVILGRDGNGWTGYLLLWLAFVAGAVTGALSFGSGNSATLWAASAAALVLALISLKLFPRAER
jgi:uncharacterized membrane protein YoaK (UPF0700 family)